MNAQNEILNNDEAQLLIDALKPLIPAPLTTAQQKKADKAILSAKIKAEKERLAKEKAAKLAREKAAREKELSDKKNQAKLNREAALKRADEERARQQKELEEFQALQAARKLVIEANEKSAYKKVSDEVERDAIGITGQGIVDTINAASAGFAVLWQEIGALPLDAAIERLNFARGQLSDSQKETLKKGVQNRCSPSNAAKDRTVWVDKLGKIGCKDGVYQIITQAESDQKSEAARKGAEKRAEEKRIKDAKKAREQSLVQSTVEPKEPVITDKPTSQISTVVRSDPLPTGTADRKRIMASLVVSIIDTYSIDEIEEIIMQLDAHITTNRITLKAVSNG